MTNATELDIRREIEANKRAIAALEAALDNRCPVIEARNGLIKRRRRSMQPLQLVVLKEPTTVCEDSD